MKTKVRKMIALLLCAWMICLTLCANVTMNVNAADANLLNTYGQYFGRVGTCINLSQLRNANTLNHIKTQYNSITLENEMKPDALLGYSPSLITVSQAKSLGYYIPDNYTETYVPKINFSTVDEVMKICYENGLGMRAHTLVWHSQTPNWFFRTGFSTNYGYVSESQMNARMEFYIKTVMNHVYTSQYGSCVYAWDVVNEYLHATNSGWEGVYGKCGNRPAFVKRAFQYAYDCISYFKLTDKVGLFYNDFNTYMEVNDIITMINYINAEKKICNGVGMQSHLGTNYPSVSYYTDALKAFVNAGFEVQITELDVTNKGDTDQANYMYQLMKNILNVKKSGGNITGLTIWGVADDVTWIKGATPLLFSRLNVPKAAYYQVLQAFADSGVGGNTGSNNNNNNNTGNNSNTGNSNVAAGYLADGWYYLKNPNAQKYLQVENNKGANGQNVEIGTGTGVQGQKWYLTNVGNGYITLKNGQGFMLDVKYGENNDGTNIQTYSANGADAQKFKLVKTSNANVFGILTKVSKDTKGLDVYNFGTSDGSNVCQWTYYQNSCQLWQFEKCNN